MTSTRKEREGETGNGYNSNQHYKREHTQEEVVKGKDECELHWRPFLHDLWQHIDTNKIYYMILWSKNLLIDILHLMFFVGILCRLVFFIIMINFII